MWIILYQRLSYSAQLETCTHTIKDVCATRSQTVEVMRFCFMLNSRRIYQCRVCLLCPKTCIGMLIKLYEDRLPGHKDNVFSQAMKAQLLIKSTSPRFRCLFQWFGKYLHNIIIFELNEPFHSITLFLLDFQTRMPASNTCAVLAKVHRPQQLYPCQEDLWGIGLKYQIKLFKHLSPIIILMVPCVMWRKCRC